MRAAHEKTDEELLRLARGGDEQAFAALYARRQAALYRFALQMSGSESVAEDAVQEVFMSLLAPSHGFDPSRGSLAAYLYGITRNMVLRTFQKERHTVALTDDAEEGDAGELLVAQDDPLGDLTRGEMIGRVRAAVLALPAHYREVVVLCELHELSYAETAEALGCAVGTVRSRLHRGRAMLVEKLRAQEAPETTQPRTLNTARCFA